jgi:large-conductance mechanosensitive channel
MLGRIASDIKSFVGGKDLVVFAIALALSTQFQETIRTLIDSMIMPFFSKLTGATRLDDRKLEISPPVGKNLSINLMWGKALKALIVFVITLIIMVEIARYLTVNFVKSSTVTFD